MKNRFVRLYLLAFSLALAAFVPNARAVIYTTFGPGDSFNTNSYLRFGTSLPTNGFADQFTSPDTVQVETALLAIDGASAGATITLTLRSNSGNLPGTLLGTFTSTSIPTQPGIVTFNATTGIQLSAGTSYWLSAIISTGQVNWFDSSQGINNAIAMHSGSTWSSFGPPDALAFELDPVPEPSLAALCTLGLATICLRRTKKSLKAKISTEHVRCSSYGRSAPSAPLWQICFRFPL